MPSYVVVLRGPSDAAFNPDGPPLVVTTFPSREGPVDLIYRLYVQDEGFSVPVPRGLWVDVRGNAPSLPAAQEAFAMAARALVPIIAVATNAPIGELDVELAYDNTPGVAEREFVQTFLPAERGPPTQRRRVDVPATISFLRAVSSHPDADRLRRSIAQYHQALVNWAPGRETLALAHLYMAIEALTKAALRNLCQQDALDEPGLAKLWRVKPESLDSEVRRRVLFQGDDACYKKAKDASDGFEHGFMAFPEVHSLALEVRDRTASYLRAAIVELAGVDDVTRSVLLDPPYNKPLASWEYSKQIHARLVGPTDELAAKDKEYPMFRWASSLKGLSRDPSGKYNPEVQENLTAQLGEGVSFDVDRFEVRGPPEDEEHSSS